MKKAKRLFILFVFLALAWVVGFAVFALHAMASKPQALEETTDAIVVLTGGNNRVQEGLLLFANGRSANLFISGVHKDATKKDITVQWDGDHNLPPCCITLGYEATTTIQNAKETRRWVYEKDFSSIRLVTGNYHMTRSLMEFRHALPDVDIYAHPVAQSDLSVTSPKLWELLFSEYHKFLVRGAVLAVLPAQIPDREK